MLSVSFLVHFLCTQIRRQQNAIFLYFSCNSNLVWLRICLRTYATTPFILNCVNGNLYYRVSKGLYERRHGTQCRRLPSQKHCHIVTTTDNITQQSQPVLSTYNILVHLTFEALNSRHFGHTCLWSRRSGPTNLLNKPYDGYPTASSVDVPLRQSVSWLHNTASCCLWRLFYGYLTNITHNT